MEGLAGLWCNALGFGNEELVETAANQMQKYGYGALYILIMMNFDRFFETCHDMSLF